jgi:hypothetical protein
MNRTGFAVKRSIGVVQPELLDYFITGLMERMEFAVVGLQVVITPAVVPNKREIVDAATVGEGHAVEIDQRRSPKAFAPRMSYLSALIMFLRTNRLLA